MGYTNCAVLIGQGRSQSVGRKMNQGLPAVVELGKLRVQSEVLFIVQST